MRVIKEGLFIVKLLLICTIFLYLIARYFNISFLFYMSIWFFVFSLFTLFFFRNPKRNINLNSSDICSPADGTVLEICEEDNEYFNAKVKVIRIFLSIFNVHVQRSPITGQIDYLNYKTGRFIPAMTELAHKVNEKNFVGICSGNKKVLFSQIAGAVARRIVFWKNKGDQVQKGDVLGMIRFGSQVDLYLPQNTEILVKKHDKVKAGETVVANWVDL